MPASAPPGTYTYRAYLGTYSTVKWDSSSFTFTKLGMDNSGSGAGEWFGVGESFDQKEALLPPSSFTLHPCHPNPFNPTTTLTFSLPEAAEVDLVVFNSRGEQVATLVEGYREAGTYQALFDGANLSTGVYFAHLRAGSYQAVQKMRLVK